MPARFQPQTVFFASPNAYVVLDREFRFVAANAAYLKATSSRLEDLLGRHIVEVFPHDPDDPGNENARRLRESLERVLATGKPDALVLLPYRIPVLRAGRIVHELRKWSTTHVPLLDAKGEVEYILEHPVDVTELQAELLAGASQAGQKEAGVLDRAALVQERYLTLDAQLRQLREIFEQAPGFMCFLRGPELRYELANAAYRALLGHRELLGKTLWEAIPELAGTVFPGLLEQVLATAKPFVGKGMPIRVQRTPSGPAEELILDFVYQPILDDAGTPMGVFVQGQDITQQRRAEERLEQALNDAQAARAQAEEANRLKDEFLATLSHELRTPLGAILGWIHMLKRGMLTQEKRDRALEVIERNAQTQAQLIEELLDASRIVSGKLSLDAHLMDMVAVVTAAVETIRPMALAKDIRLELDLQLDACPMTGDARRLQQVVWNLLSNAVKFTPKNGLVQVSLGRSRDTVTVTVKDNGIGIAPAFLPTVFERFRQAEAGNTRETGGLGLGLSIVRHLVEAHHGEVRAFSEGLGKGATFSITLPCVEVPAALGQSGAILESVPAKEDLLALDGLHVLVVEDDADTREYLCALLERASARVTEASNAGEAYSAVKREHPDAIVSDIAMAEGDGYSLIRKVRALPPEEGGRTPAVALTAYSRAEDRTRALLAGFQDHLAKPVEPLELLATLRALARRH